MASSEVEIVNVALTQIGQDTIISLDPPDDSEPARAAYHLFGPARDALIRRYRWNFAIKRTSLSPESDSPSNSGFDYKFMLPSDCLRAIGVYDADEPQQNYTSGRIPWKVEGGFVLCDESPLPLVYLAQITDVAQFDPLFSDALSWDLAVRLGYKLTAGPDLVANAKREFREVIRQAKLADAFEGTPEQVDSSEWLDAHSNSYHPRWRPGPVTTF